MKIYFKYKNPRIRPPPLPYCFFRAIVGPLGDPFSAELSYLCAVNNVTTDGRYKESAVRQDSKAQRLKLSNWVKNKQVPMMKVIMLFLYIDDLVYRIA